MFHLSWDHVVSCSISTVIVICLNYFSAGINRKRIHILISLASDKVFVALAQTNSRPFITGQFTITALSQAVSVMLISRSTSRLFAFTAFTVRTCTENDNFNQLNPQIPAISIQHEQCLIANLPHVLPRN